MFGRRPVASSRSEPHTSDSTPPRRRRTVIAPSEVRATATTAVPVCMLMPSASRISLMACETSGSSRAATARRALHHGHRAAKTPVHLRKLKADITATENNQMFRQTIELHNGTVRQIRHRGEPRNVRHDGARAHVDEDSRRTEEPLAHAQLGRAFETGMAAYHGAVLHLLQPLLDAVACIERHRRGPLPDGAHVHAHRAADVDTILRGTTRQVGRVGAGHQRLGGHATGVDAGAAE